MSIRGISLAGALALVTLALSPLPASAHATREFTGSFGSGTPAGIAIDQETGNVYVADQATETIDVFGENGGVPAGGAAATITGVVFAYAVGPSGIAVDNSCYEHIPRLTGAACEEFDPSYGDVYVVAQRPTEEARIQKFKLNGGKGYELVEELAPTNDVSDISDQLHPVDDGVAVDPRGNVYVVSFFVHSVVEFRKIVEKVSNGGKEEIKENLEEIHIHEGLEARVGEPDGSRGPSYVVVDDLGDLYLGDELETGGPSDGYLGVAKLRVGEAGNVISEEILDAKNVEHVDRRPACCRSFYKCGVCWRRLRNRGIQSGG